MDLLFSLNPWHVLIGGSAVFIATIFYWLVAGVDAAATDEEPVAPESEADQRYITKVMRDRNIHII
jgi:hypothetical protein